MSGIFDQIINYSPPLIVSGTVNYKGTWNASTNTPTLIDPPVASTKGDYYVVSTAGTQFSITFGVGDWIISNGTAWEKVDLTDAVSSVFGRTGAVVGVSTDYSAVGITNTAIGATNPSTGAFTTVSASGLTVNDNTTLGSSNSDTVNFNARVASDFNPSTDDTYDLGRTGHEWRDLHIDGTANIDSLVADSADINGGTIDGTAIGATTPSTGAFTTLSATTTLSVNRSGVAAPTPIVTNAAQLVGATGESISLQLDTFAATPFIYGVRAQGTAASPTATASGNNLLAFEGRGWQTNTLQSTPGARILFQATENYTNTASGGKLLLQAVANGTVAPTTIADISSTGLAVTGALSATGELASFGSSGGVNNRLKASYNSSSGVAVFGPDSNGGTTSLNIGVSNAGTYNTVLGISTTGLAVTGALSATGEASAATFVSNRFAVNSNPLNIASTAQSFVRFQTTGADFYVGTESSTGGNFFPGSTAYAAVLYNAPATPMHFYTDGTIRATITSGGNVGIGVTAPGDKLEIGGSGSGIILASANGTRYRVTVSNLGVLTVAAV